MSCKRSLSSHIGGAVFHPALRARVRGSSKLLRVVSNARRSERRRLAVVGPPTSEESATPESISPFESAATAQALTRVQEALNSLDIEHRTVFVLFEFAGESCDAIAKVLRVPIGTVYSRLSSARQQVRARYLAEQPSIARSDLAVAPGEPA